ncbi:MAG: hypothetical protein ABI162_08355, partial [Luteolibacter sp.]
HHPTIPPSPIPNPQSLPTPSPIIGVIGGHLLNRILDFSHLRMHLPDEIMFRFRKLLNPLRLLLQLVEHLVLLAGNLVHPAKANRPARSPQNSQPECNQIHFHLRHSNRNRFPGKKTDRETSFRQ